VGTFDSRDGPVPAVRDVSFDLRPGEALGIVGESGSGKSTLALAIMQLLPSNGRITAGSISFAGLDLVGAPTTVLRRLRGRRIAIVFQDSMSSLNPVLPIGLQITESLTWHLNLSRRQARAKAIELLSEVGVSEPERRLGQLPHQLSGGLRQRVAISIALAADPDVLIADEPTTALDVTIQAQLLELLRREKAARHMSMILITHDHGVVARTCDRVAVMYAGRIVEVGETSEIFRDARHPYSLGLQTSVPRFDRVRPGRLPSIAGAPPPMIDLPPGCPFEPRCPFAVERSRVEEPTLAPVPGGRPGHEAACWVDTRGHS
jgi:peptide/nickel transport system ATP-binding protein